MFVVTVEFTSKPKKNHAMEKLLRKQALNSFQKETDCLHFDIARSTDNPQHFFLYEIYRSAEAFQTHLASAHFMTFSHEIAPLVADKQVQTWQLSTPFNLMQPGGVDHESLV